MFKDFEQARQFVDEHSIRAVDLKYCDLWGRWRHLTIPASQFGSDLMTRGIGFDGSSVGLKNIKAGDMVMAPDLTTGFQDPFWDVPTLSFVCTTLNADTHEIFANDPRNLAQQAESYLVSTGIATQSRWGPEFEFYIFDSVSYENEILRAGYRFNSKSAEWNSEAGISGSYIPVHGGYHAAPPKDRFYNLRNEITLHLEAMGIPVKYHHHEVGQMGTVISARQRATILADCCTTVRQSWP
jgi:glutamine synthetase